MNRRTINEDLSFFFSLTILLLFALHDQDALGLRGPSRWLREAPQKVCGVQRVVKSFLEALDQSLDGMKDISLMVKAGRKQDSEPVDVSEETSVTSNDTLEPSERGSDGSRRKKRFFGSSFNPENVLRNALNKLNLDQIFAKLLETLDVEQIIRKLNIPGMIEKSMGDLRKLIEQQLDLPDLLLKQLKKMDIDSLVNQLLAQLNLFSLLKEKLNASNFETILNDLLKHLDLKKLINEKLNIQDLMNEVIAKVNFNQGFQYLTKDINVDTIINKLRDVNDGQSPLKRLLTLLKLDKVAEHLFDPQWILQRFLPDIDETGIARLIADFHRTLQQIAGGTEHFKNILVKNTVEKAIPFLITILDPQRLVANDLQFGPTDNRRSTTVSSTFTTHRHSLALCRISGGTFLRSNIKHRSLSSNREHDHG